MSFSDELLEDEPLDDELGPLPELFGDELTLDQLVQDYIDEVLEGDYG